MPTLAGDKRRHGGRVGATTRGQSFDYQLGREVAARQALDGCGHLVVAFLTHTLILDVAAGQNEMNGARDARELWRP